MAPKSFDLQGSSKVKFAIFTTTFVDLYRSNGGSYDFGAMETFVQRAKIYKYTNFHPNRTEGKFPIGSLPCPLKKNLDTFVPRTNVFNSFSTKYFTAKRVTLVR